MTVTATRADIIYFRNADYRRTFQLVGASGSPVDIGGWTFEFAVSAAAGEVWPDYSFDVAIDDAAEGRFSVTIPPNAVSAGEWLYEIVSTDATGKRRIRQSGRFVSRDGVTQPLAPIGGANNGLTIDFAKGLARLAFMAPNVNEFHGAPGGLLTYASPSRKYIRTRRGRLEAGTAVRCEFGADGEALGLHLERRSANLFTRSQDAAHNQWIKTGIVATADGGRAPDGDGVMARLTEDAAGNVHRIHMAMSLTAGQRYSMSCFVRRRGRDLAIRMPFSGGAGEAHFDLAAGEARVFSGAGFDAGMESFADGVWRCRISGVATETRSRFFAFHVLSAAGPTYTGDGTSGLDIWGMQMEAGPTTSYIRTEAAAATRAADVLTLPIDRLPGGANGGTMRIEARQNGIPVTPTSEYWSMETDDRHRIYFWQDDIDPADVRWIVEDDTVQANRRLTPATPGGFFTAAARAHRDNFGWSVDGGAVDTDSGGTVPDLTGGTMRLAGDDGDYHVKSLAWIPSHLNDEIIRELAR